ncbi:PH, RCC1 and FYVE domains-containing protein 1 isoform X1 [Ricinus communis]|uniref:PH, RCC1 and FYVE domains-containing protein 1 isoform X1 n=1 Tax=Ricinus communis TaxID=3988 RepID=UPI00077272E0|nr:PH, RCC1 and FYVE domains-containing protein 1 isoform X1 [Ricinus communis]|eukprot:XP_015576845.1 PH, RCC1 and FYVE domains-containing protein 1 [Ricinus communis]
MADTQRVGLAERDIEQAITSLKKGAYLLKYGRRGKPKFCPFQLSSDESMLIWYSGKEEKQLKLSQVSKIIPGQRTAIFQRYPRPEKEYQSFSLIYSDRSLDLICKDKDEAEVWFVGLKALITRGSYQSKWRIEPRSESTSSDSPHIRTRRHSRSISPFDAGHGDGQGSPVPFESIPSNRLGKAFCDIISYTAAEKSPSRAELLSSPFSSLNAACVDNSNGRTSTADTVRVSLSSAVSSSSQGSYHEDFDALGDVFFWGEGVGDGILGGGVHITGITSSPKVDAFLPKALESKVVLDVHYIACGGRHAVLVTKPGEIFSWGEESGGRLGHGIKADVPNPKLIDTLAGMNIELVACGENHTCAVTFSGDLYTWGDGAYNCGLLGHGSEASHWIPKRIGGDMEGIHVSYVSCGPWHTAAVTSVGQLFTFGDGTFGALGHGDHSSATVPREVETLRGLRTIRVSCGVWHTAAAVEITTESSSPGGSGSSTFGKLFTWGNGDEYRLGHGDKEPRLFPECVVALGDENICQVACGHNLTLALTAAGRVYTMGSTSYGQLGNPRATGKVPAIVEGKIAGKIIEEIACGSYHVAVLTSKAEVYTWGKGTNGQLGHGDNKDRNQPTVVDFLRDKQVRAVACGSNFTAIICLHKWVSSADHSVCSGCHNPFGFRRKRHNCYNCGLVFCKACSSRKSLKASLAPNMNKPHRVCDDCFNKLKKAAEPGTVPRIPKSRAGNLNQKTNEAADRETLDPKLQTQLSRLPSLDSASQAESWHSRRDRISESDTTRVFPVLIGNWQLGHFYSSKGSSFLGGTSTNFFLNPASGSRMPPPATPPLPGRTTPPRSSFDDSKHMNDSLSDEIISLRAQVEDLTLKSCRLEAELERKSRQLKEVAAIAADEAEKRKSAKEVIKSLTAQLKQMAEKLPERRSPSPISGSITKHISSAQNISSSESHSSSDISPETDSNGNSSDHHMLYRSKSQNDKPQWVIQAEPGVYITLSSLPGGTNELKRIRFSRKHFTEQQAEKWWAENGTRVCERHNIQNTD